MAALALPEMGVGENKFPTPTSPRTPVKCASRTCGWSVRPPSPRRPPQAAIYPANGGTTDGTNVVFRWQPSADPDGQAITDYQFDAVQVPDMRWPLSMDFRKFISRTADHGRPLHAASAPAC